MKVNKQEKRETILLTIIRNYWKNITIVAIIILSCIAWFILAPIGLEDKAWHLFVIFIATIISLIFNPVPMGVTALISILVCILTNTLTIEQGLSGFSNQIVWLVIFAFFISHGFIKTGLGSRISYYIILRLGHSILGLSYALVLIDLILAPFIPSVSARGAGIIFPIVKSLCQSYSDEDHPGISLKNGGFLMKVCYQSNVITSSMFVTAMAANPLAVKLAADAGIVISWIEWTRAAIVPGIISLIVMPIVIYYLHPPAIKYSDSAPQVVREKLENMGKISFPEIIMLVTFFVLIFLWILGDKLGISTTTVALLGLCCLYLFRIVNFEENMVDKNAWHTFLWFSTLIMLSGFLTQFGLITWVKDKLDYIFIGYSPVISVIILSLIYFYIHYLLASATTHIVVLFPTFFILFVSASMPPLLSALVLSFLSILSSGLTQFGLASAPVFFSAGYLKAKVWWYLGFILSIIYIIIWTIVGGIWWKFLELW